MERIQAAIQKAKEQRTGMGISPVRDPANGTAAHGVQIPRGQAGAAWGEIGTFEPDAEHLARHRIVTFSDTDPAHNHFDMLRTKVLRTMQRNGWKTIGITSPTSGCGKTTISLNLAFSLSHQPNLRTVLVDLDLRRPVVGKHLGITETHSVASVLQGTHTVQENFLRYGDNLAVGTNAQSICASADLLMDARTAGGVRAIRDAFRPDILIYDLPPMLVSDDAMAFLPHLDCVLLVAGAEKSRLDEIDKCEQDLAGQANVLGVVLNMCRYASEEYGYY